MRKKIYLLVGCISFVILLFILISFSVMAINKKNWSDVISDNASESWSQVNGAFLNEYNEQLNSKLDNISVYDFKKFMLYCPRWNANLSSSSQVNSLQLLNYMYHIEHIQIVDENKICVIYRFSYDDNDCTYAFVFLDKHTDAENTAEMWYRTGEVYFLNNLYSSEEYSDVAIGTSVKKLCEKDIGVYYDYEYIGTRYIIKCEDGIDIERFGFVTIRVLSDGIMFINSEIENNTLNDVSDINAYTVSNIYFIPYGETIPDSIAYNSQITIKNADVFECLNGVE